MPDPYSFFRPLLAADKRWVALEWCPTGVQPFAAGDLAHCFVAAETAKLATALPLILSIDPEWLQEIEFVETFDSGQVIFVFPAATINDPGTLAMCAEWRKRGYHFALQIDSAQLVKRVPRAVFDHVQVDAASARYELAASDLNHLSHNGLARIVGGVDSLGLFEWLSERRFEFIDSSFVTQVNPTAKRTTDPARLKVLRLLSMVIEDADTREIEKVFREEASLAFNLLRLVNTVAVGAKTHVTSFQQALALLGRRQLQRWLQLLIYADQLTRTSKPNPLLQLAAARGRQMELLSAALDSSGSQEVSEMAFMTGIFSLLDVLLRMPMREILAELPLSSEVAAALGSHQGLLGSLLAAIVASETGDFTLAQKTLHGLDISPASQAKAQTEAFHWASGIDFSR